MSAKHRVSAAAVTAFAGTLFSSPHAQAAPIEAVVLEQKKSRVAATCQASARAVARLAASSIAQQVSDYARGMVPTAGDEHLQPGELRDCAKRLRALSMAFDEAALRYERAAGTDWARLAGHMDPGEFAAEHPDAADQAAIIAASLEDLGEPPGEAAARLDAWYAKTAAPRVEGPPSNAVSGGLA